MSQPSPATEHVARLVGLNVVRDGDTLFRRSARRGHRLADRAGGVGRDSLARAGSPAPRRTATRYACSSTPTPADLIADVTPAAATELGLAPGREVWLSVKETRRVDAARREPAD